MTDELEPPWAKFPTYSPYTIGWRMGPGEDFNHEWYEFVGRDLTTLETTVAYLRRHRPAPETWHDVVALVLGAHLPKDSEETIDALIEEHRLVREDVAYSNWLTQQLRDQGVKAPWARGFDYTAKIAVGFDTRGIHFWARWCQDQRSTGELETWLATQPEPRWWAWRWKRVFAALTGERASAWHNDPLERLLCVMARTGAPPPPWIDRAEPPSRPARFDPILEYSDAWLLWVRDVFDDEPTWRAYLEQHPPAPIGWRGTTFELLRWPI
jgi:hypothetical protein